ncbi:MAG: tetratricopeptide repeat protein [Chloroflexi bacterium]|nr:tetratricopeptide repeat protein [Chloroflexota bacterium]MCI0578807.1 tetratricopeptide repeat protein [Chloroflexota bacterium]MCI0644701.1 tetratricopeptide repeat protein [Chloroflexota bacterium]MCI0730399.1 tetratricopeptide repeat protein [Chloroflexota bacterium]
MNQPYVPSAQSTPFIGRQAELAEINRCLADAGCRLLTLIGPGGVGKTRLVREALDHLPAGARAYLIPLASVPSADLLVPTIAAALDFSFYGEKQNDESARQQLFNYLQRQKLVLALDDFDHLRDGTPLLVEMLSAAPNVKILVTAEERLELPEERPLPVHGLPYPAEDANPEEAISYDAVQLFVHCARKAQPDFSLSAEEAPAVVQICQLLDGLPLGIELVAPWVELFSCRTIARELERNLPFLAGPAATGRESQRSLAAVFENSWNRLPAEEQFLIWQLTVFEGGFRPEAAAYVCGATPAQLATLAEKSFLRPAGSRGQENSRYEIPVFFKRFIQEKAKALDEYQREAAEMEARNRHCDYFVAFLKEREARLKDDRQIEAVAEITREIENVRAAWNWATSQAREVAIGQALDSLYYFYELRSWFHEGVRALSRASRSLARYTGGLTDLMGRVFARQAWFLLRLSQYESAAGLLQDSLLILLRHSAGQEEVAFTLGALGVALDAQGKHAEAQRNLQESLSLYQAADDPWGTANALIRLGNNALSTGSYREGRDFYGQAATLCEEHSYVRGFALCLNNLAHIAEKSGEYVLAKEMYQESLALREDIGDQVGVAFSLNNLGYIAFLLGEYEEALSHLQRSLAIFESIGERRGQAYALDNTGHVALARQEYGKAREMYGQSQAIFLEIGDPAGVAFSSSDLGHALFALGEHGEARQQFVAALRLSQGRPAWVALAALSGLAALLAQEGKAEQAVSLAAVIRRHNESNPKTRERAQLFLEQMEERLPPEQFNAARQRGEAQGLKELIIEIVGS